MVFLFPDWFLLGTVVDLLLLCFLPGSEDCIMGIFPPNEEKNTYVFVLPINIGVQYVNF